MNVKIGKLNGFQIKMIMALLMVLDHLYYIPGFIPDNLVGVFHIITRCVGVWFAYAAVEGFIHTRSRIKYNVRLFLWAGIMFIGNQIFNVNNNIFLTLAVGVLCLNIICYKSESIKYNDILVKVIRSILIILVTFSSFLYAEGAMPMIPFMLITYLLRNNLKWRNMAYFLLSGFLFLTSFVVYDSVSMTLKMLAHNSDFMFITVIPFIYLYNGERGPQDIFGKYFFYLFYPGHLWLIATIAYFTTR